MGKPLTLETTVFGSGDSALTMADIIGLTVANRHNVGELMGAAIADGFEPTPYVDSPSEIDAYKVTLVREAEPSGFNIHVWLTDLHRAGHFNSVQLKADFPTGVDFIGATEGELIENFFFGVQAKDGHPKEGLVGAFTSSLGAVDGREDGNEDSELLCTLHFEGPEIAMYMTEVVDFKLQLSRDVLKMSSDSEVQHA